MLIIDYYANRKYKIQGTSQDHLVSLLQEYEPRRRPGIAFLITGVEHMKPVAVSLARQSRPNAAISPSQTAGFVEASAIPFVGARIIRDSKGGATLN